jgi:Transposase
VISRHPKQLGDGAKLEAVTINMSGAYIKAVTEAAPKAKLVFDRFLLEHLGLPTKPHLCALAPPGRLLMTSDRSLKLLEAQAG